MEPIEVIARRTAIRRVQEGRVILSTGGDRWLIYVFKCLGWSDPHEDPVDIFSGDW